MSSRAGVRAGLRDDRLLTGLADRSSVAVGSWPGGTDCLTSKRYGIAIVEWRVLSGPAILRISVLLLIAGVLAALVQFLLPAEPPPVAKIAAVVRPAEPPTPPEAPVPASPAQPAQAPSRRDEIPKSPAQMPADALAFPLTATSPPIPAAPIQAAPLPPQPRGEAEVARAADDVGPRALALVDLNTASVADLNRLQRGGAIGRAIVSKRPYASVDQLMSKRVLSRAVYDRIKEQVTVR